MCKRLGATQSQTKTSIGFRLNAEHLTRLCNCQKKHVTNKELTFSNVAAKPFLLQQNGMAWTNPTFAVILHTISVRVFLYTEN